MKLVKNPIFMFILGVIISGCVAFAATQINANEIKYDNTHSVKDKIDDLYTTATSTIANLNSQISELEAQSQSASSEDLTPVLLWTNPSPTTAFGTQTISLDLSEYKYVIIVVNSSTSSSYNSYGIVPVGNSYNIGIARPDNAYTARHFSATTTGITTTAAKYGSSTYNGEVIPYKIYGIKGELGIDIFE